MIKTGARSIVSQISRLFDLMPEPMVLRAMDVPEPHRARR